MKKIGIYPGNFQPPTKAHYNLYKKLKTVIGNNDVYIASTDREPTPEAPLNYGDKEQIWIRHGVPASHIIKVQTLPTDDPSKGWKPKEILHNISENHTTVIIILSERESHLFSTGKGSIGKKWKGISAGEPNEPLVNEISFSEPDKKPISKSEEPKHTPEEPEKEDPQDIDFKIAKQIKKTREGWYDIDGKLKYFQPYKGNEHALRPVKEHAYIIISDDSRIQGKQVATSNIRVVLGSDRYTDKQKKSFFNWSFGWFDISLFRLLAMKFRQAYQFISRVDTPLEPHSSHFSTRVTNPREPSPMPKFPKNVYNPKKKLQEMVREILKELMDEEYSSSSVTTMNGMDDTQPDSSSDMASTIDKEKSPAQQKSDAAKQKVDLNKQKAQAERDLKGLETDLNWKKSDILRKRKDELPNKRKELDTLNKQIASVSSSTPSI